MMGAPDQKTEWRVGLVDSFNRCTTKRRFTAVQEQKDRLEALKKQGFARVEGVKEKNLFSQTDT